MSDSPSTPAEIVEAWTSGLTSKAREHLSLYDLQRLEDLIEHAGIEIEEVEAEAESEAEVIVLDEALLDEPTHKAQTITSGDQADLKMSCPANSLIRVWFELGGPQASNLIYQEIECSKLDVESSQYIQKPTTLENLAAETQLMLMDTGTGFELVHDPLKTHNVNVRVVVRNTKRHGLRVHLQVVK